MLLVEVILAHKAWTPRQWDLTYTDLPNRLVRVEVGDRNIFKTTDAERKLVEPQGTQAQLDALVAKFKDGRSFARASGTEDAVRVYAEAATRSEADDLAQKVASAFSLFHLTSIFSFTKLEKMLTAKLHRSRQARGKHQVLIWISRKNSKKVIDK